ncbi:MAG TPA: hypothetical protein PLZ62_03725 [bacterium]|nr:hypothetical protein [bacterium]
MDTIFWVLIIIYTIVMLVLLAFNLLTIRHILRYRFRGDASMAVLAGYVLVVAVLLLITTFSLMALSWAGRPGGYL